MWVIIGITLIIIGIILLISAFRNHDPDQEFNMSSNMLDARAQNALRITEHRIRTKRATTRDFFRRGRIMQLGLLQNEPQLEPTPLLEQIARDYEMALGLHQDNYHVAPDVLGGIIQFMDVAAGNTRLATNVITATKNSAATDLKNAIDVTDNRFDATVHAITVAAAPRNDLQNVHDTSVNNDLRHTINVMRQSAAGQSIDALINDCSEYVRSTGNAKAIETLNVMVGGGKIYGTDEKEILAITWARAHCQENAHQSAALRSALIDALADSYENNVMVCANGRSARVLGSGVTIDSNPSIGVVHTVGDIRREVFNDIKRQYEDMITEASLSPDQTLATLGKVYLGTSNDDIDEVVDQQFKESLKARVDEIITGRVDLSTADRRRITDEAYVYLGIDD